MNSRTLFFVTAISLGLATATTYLWQTQRPLTEASKPTLLEYSAPAILSTGQQSSTVIEKSTQPEHLPNTPPKDAETATAFTQPDSALSVSLTPWEVAITTPSDEEFYRIVEFMKLDPNFLAGVMQEFQSEQDPKRQRWLAFMLGELRNKPEITALAGQMLFSGNTDSASAALALLSHLQKNDPMARDLVLQSLGTNQDPEALIAAMNALARPTPDVSDSQKQQILQQITPLTQHPLATVRRHSYDLLFRWVSDAPYMSQQLRMGLSDADPKVRRSTVIGFIDHPQLDDTIKLSLMDVLNNLKEQDRNRKLAAKALSKFTLSSDEKTHIQATLRTIQ